MCCTTSTPRGLAPPAAVSKTTPRDPTCAPSPPGYAQMMVHIGHAAPSAGGGERCQYSLGVLAFHVLTGRPPFLGDAHRLLYAHAHEPPPPLWDLRPGLPGIVYAVIAETLSKDPTRRPARAADLASALARGARPAAVPSSTEREAETPASPPLREPAPAIESPLQPGCMQPARQRRQSPTRTPVQYSPQGGGRPEG